MSFILQWIDVLWLPVGYLFVHKQHRMLSVGFFFGCMIMMRLQVELMQSIGYPAGLIGFWSAPVFSRGIMVYSVFYIIFLLLAHYSAGTRKIVFLAASISMFFLALFVSTLAMVL